MDADAFDSRILGIIAHGYLTSGISTGSRLGIFKHLGKIASCRAESVTSQQLADSMKFKERMIREWANSMVCGNIIDHEEIDGSDRYWIEPYRMRALCDTAFSSELFTATVETLGLVENCYPLDGPPGTDVDDHPKLHDWLSRVTGIWSDKKVMKDMLAEDSRLESLLQNGAKVLEVGGGSGRDVHVISQHYPRSEFVCSDLSGTVLDRARERCKGLSNVQYAVLDPCSIPPDMEEQFDFVYMFDVFHDVPYPDKLANGLLRTLKPGGILLMNDIGVGDSVTENKRDLAEKASVEYTLSTLYCVPTSINHPGGVGLGACVGKEKILQMLREAGFVGVKTVAENTGFFVLATKPQ